MDQSKPSAATSPRTDLAADWVDPLDDAVRGWVHAFIERLLEEVARGDTRPPAMHYLAAKGHYNGHRERRLDTTFGPLVLTVPRARRKWRSELLPAYPRLSRRAER